MKKKKIVKIAKDIQKMYLLNEGFAVFTNFVQDLVGCVSSCRIVTFTGHSQAGMKFMKIDFTKNLTGVFYFFSIY